MLLPNIHTVFEIEISIIANHTEIENLEKVSGCWKEKLRTTVSGKVLKNPFSFPDQSWFNCNMIFI